MIKVSNLRKSYKEVQALKDVSFRVPAGELFAYLGPNGAGKTTTIRILTGITKRSGGDAWINGFHVEHEPLDAKRQCGVVPQTVNLDNELTVLENLTIHGLLFRMPAAERTEKIRELLDYVGLDDREKTPVARLSGGMKRRLAIARALVHFPKVLFLDEPTVGLDAGIRRRIWALIKRVQKRGTTIFLTTHYIEEAEFLAQRVAFLDEGRIIAVDRPQALMSRQGSWAIDRIAGDSVKTIYFKTKEAAKEYTAAQDEGFSFRRVNLEDAFLALTGKKVE